MNILHRLIEAGNKDGVRAVLESTPHEELKTFINVTEGQSQKSALMLAAEAGWADVIPLFARAGADLKLRDFYETDALQLAVMAGKHESVEALLQSGASANTRRFTDGVTALHTAIEAKDAPMVRLLLDYGADIAARTPPAEDKMGLNAFHVAALHAPELMDMLLAENGAADAVSVIARREKHDISPLRIALGAGNRALVEKLLDFGVSPNERDSNGETPVFYLLAHRSSREEAMPLLRLLRERGADINSAVNYWNESPLFPAVRESFTEAASFLLSQGLDAKQVSQLGETPLHLAAEKWDEHIVRALVKAGADVNAPNKQQKTPLMLAAHANRLKVVEALLDAGANPYLKDNKGKTARDLCPAHFQQNVNNLISRKEQEIDILMHGYNAVSRDTREKEAESSRQLMPRKPLRGGRTRFSERKHSSNRFGNRR